MHNTTIIKTPAKINLHLDIIGKRDDGFHELISLFQMISLYDTLSFTILNSIKTIRIEGNLSIPIEKNIIQKVYNVFQEFTGINTGVKVTIKKRIPIGAGLGGGSSNAAATLLVLNKIFNTSLSLKQLIQLASKVGCDIPFFINNTATAMVTGKGEQIKPLPSRINYYFLIINPGFQINTGSAYQWLDMENEKSRIKLQKEDIEKNYLEKSIKNWNFQNSFNHVLIQRYPFFSDIFNTFNRFGVQYYNISGSGSSVFGIFEDKSHLKQVYNQLRSKYLFIKTAKALDKNPLPILE